MLRACGIFRLVQKSFFIRRCLYMRCVAKCIRCGLSVILVIQAPWVLNGCADSCYHNKWVKFWNIFFVSFRVAAQCQVSCVFFIEVGCRKQFCLLWLPRAVAFKVSCSQIPRRDSNPGPSGWESDILTIRPRCSTIGCSFQPPILSFLTRLAPKQLRAGCP
jgi:hypothetical protein